MSTMVVDSRVSTPIVIGASGLEEISQNIRMILTTIKGTVSLDRTFGLSLTFLDRPLPEAMAEYTGEVVSEVERLEPRVHVQNVDFQALPDDAMAGRLYPVVTCEVLNV